MILNPDKKFKFYSIERLLEIELFQHYILNWIRDSISNLEKLLFNNILVRY